MLITTSSVPQMKVGDQRQEGEREEERGSCQSKISIRFLRQHGYRRGIFFDRIFEIRSTNLCNFGQNLVGGAWRDDDCGGVTAICLFLKDHLNKPYFKLLQNFTSTGNDTNSPLTLNTHKAWGIKVQRSKINNISPRDQLVVLVRLRHSQKAALGVESETSKIGRVVGETRLHEVTWDRNGNVSIQGNMLDIRYTKKVINAKQRFHSKTYC